MSITDTTAKSQTEALSFEFELRHAPEKVWRALTDPNMMKEWLLPVVEERLELQRGAGFTLQAPAFPGWDGKVNCQLLEVEAPRRLRYSWVVGGDMGLDTEVTFTLSPTDTGTRLSLVQSGFKPAQKQNFGGARYGWNLMGGKLVELLERLG